MARHRSPGRVLWSSRGAAGVVLAALIGAGPAAALAGTGPAARAGQRCVARAEVRGVVTAATADYLRGALAAARACEMLLVRLDTPGGQLQATQEIATLFLEARVPVVVYVAPGAARGVIPAWGRTRTRRSSATAIG